MNVMHAAKRLQAGFGAKGVFVGLTPQRCSDWMTERNFSHKTK